MVEDDKKDEKKLKALRKVRGGHRGYATKLLKTTETILKEFGEPTESTDVSMLTTDLKTNIVLLKEKLVELKTLDAEILELIEPEAEFEKELVDAGEHNRRISRMIVASEEQISSSQEKKVDKKINKPETSGRSNPVRLPRLDFQTFNGDPLEWKSFWDTFECIVDNDSSLDDMMKFSYLRQKLDGKAKIALDGLTLTKANYKEAVKLLKERFGDEQYIIQAHMDALLALEPIIGGDVAALRKLSDVVEVHIRNLQQFEIAVKNYGPVLISIIVNKLPKDVNLEIVRQMPDGKWEIQKLMEVMKKEVMARERCHQRNKYEDFDGSMSTLHVGDGRGNGGGRGGRGNRGGRGGSNHAKGHKKVCAFCDRNNHSSESCRTVTSIKER